MAKNKAERAAESLGKQLTIQGVAYKSISVHTAPGGPTGSFAWISVDTADEVYWDNIPHTWDGYDVSPTASGSSFERAGVSRD